MMKHIVIPVGEDLVHLYAEEASIPPLLLKEAARGKGQPLTGPYSYRKDPPHTNPGQHHLHLYSKNNELLAINWDGTAHDRSHGVAIPSKAYDALKARFPDLVLPANRIVESMSPLALGIVVETITKTGMQIEEIIDLQVLLREFQEAQKGIRK